MALLGGQRSGAELRGELDRLARHFKVSTLVVLCRMRDAGFPQLDEYQAAYEDQPARLHEPAKGGGGNFYSTVSARVSKRFVSTFAGQSSYTDMF